MTFDPRGMTFNEGAEGVKFIVNGSANVFTVMSRVGRSVQRGFAVCEKMSMKRPGEAKLM